MANEGRVPLSELCESDVLLFHGKSTLSKLIRLFDGTDVSHAGLFRADATVAEALGKGLERRPIDVSAAKNDWVRVMRLRSLPDSMLPVAAVSDRYLSTPNRYGYEQILLLAFLGISRRVPVTPLLAPLLRKVLDGAASLVSKFAAQGRTSLICSEFVYRCYGEAEQGDGDPYEIAIAGVGGRGGARGLRAPAVGQVETGSLLHGLMRAPASREGRRALAPPRQDRRSLDALGEAYLKSAKPGRIRALAAGPSLLTQVEPELLRFASAVAAVQGVRGGGRALAGTPTRARAAAALTKAVAKFVTPGDLLKSPSLQALGHLDLGSRGMRALATPAVVTRKGTAMAKHALCIGINDYPGTGNDLAGCVNDARDWAAAFKARGFSVASLLDRDASGKNVRAAIRQVIAKARSGDVVAIQYSGHGSFVPDENGDEPDGNDECICPRDITTKGPITDDELFEMYSARQAGVRLVVFSDSCHSGSVARFAPIMTPATVRGRSAPQRRVRFLPPANFLSRSVVSRMGPRRLLRRSNPPGRFAALLMAGCQDAEYSFDAYFQGRPNGAFTYVALDTLKKLPKKATYLDWYTAIRRVLPSQQYAQSPNLFGSLSMKKWAVLA